MFLKTKFNYRVLGRLKLKETGYLPTEGARVLSATVSEKAGRWFVSVQCEVNIPDPQPGNKPVCGVDLGIKTMAVVSDGTMFENPKSLKRNLTKIKRLQRVVSRRKKGSQNRRKAVAQLAKAHAKVANIRKKLSAPGHQPVGEKQVNSCSGKPECEWDDAQSSACAGYQRCRFC